MWNLNPGRWCVLDVSSFSTSTLSGYNYIPFSDRALGARVQLEVLTVVQDASSEVKFFAVDPNYFALSVFREV